MLTLSKHYTEYVYSERITFNFKAMPGVKVQVDIPTDGNSVRTPMVDGEPGQVNFSNIKYRFLFTFIFNTIFLFT